MKNRIVSAIVSVLVPCVLSAANEASAQTSTCTTNHASCLTVTNFSSTLDGSAISGTNSNGIGIFGTTNFGFGVVGKATSTGGVGVSGTTMGTYGVKGTSIYGVGVSGEVTDPNTTGTGVEGISTKGTGVEGISNTSYGVWGKTSGPWKTAAGVYGTTHGAAPGVRGSASTFGTGVSGEAGVGGYGVYGESSGIGYGIYGFNATSDSGGYAVYAGGRAGGTSAWFVDSDVRLKKDIQSSPHGLSDLLRLRPVIYKLKEGGDVTQLGLIAQEVQKVVPEVVRTNGKTGFLSVGYCGLVPVVIKAAQEQQQMLQEQKDIVARLEARIAMLERSQTHVSSLPASVVAPSMAFALLPAAVVAIRRRRRSTQSSRRSPSADG